MPLFDPNFLRTLEYLSFVARRLLAGEEVAERESRKKGGCVEFRDYRVYTPGDELRYVDWNVYARHGQLFVKEFHAEEDIHVAILLDASASMAFGQPPKREAAWRLAAALTYIGLAHFDSVSLLPFRERFEESLLRLRGKARIFDVLRFLEALPAQGRTNLEECSSMPLPLLRGRVMPILLSDFYDRRGAREALRRLQGQSLPLFALHLVAPQERCPAPEGRLRLVDAETGEEEEFFVSAETRAAYEERFRVHLRELQSLCTAHEVGYCEVLSTTGLEQALLDLIGRRGLLRERR